MTAWTYILRLKSGQLYIGSTTGLNNRFANHTAGRACRTTKLDPPVKMVYSEALTTFSEARKREAKIKSWTRAKKEALVSGDLAKFLPKIDQWLKNTRQITRLWKMLLTERKSQRGDEFFNLRQDIRMKDNLIKAKNLMPVIAAYKKLLYQAYKYYLKKGKIILKGSSVKSHMSADDQKTLRSLGYL